MIHVIYKLATGEIVQHLSNCPVEDVAANTEVDEVAVVVTEEPPADSYVLAGAVVPRPVVSIATVAGAAPLEVELGGLPLGTTVSVTNEEGDRLTVTDLSEDLLLEDDGRYKLVITPPFPYLPHRKEITLD